MRDELYVREFFCKSEHAEIMIAVPVADHNVGHGFVGKRSNLVDKLFRHGRHAATVENDYAFVADNKCRVPHDRESGAVRSHTRPNARRKLLELEYEWPIICDRGRGRENQDEEAEGEHAHQPFDRAGVISFPGLTNRGQSPF